MFSFTGFISSNTIDHDKISTYSDYSKIKKGKVEKIPKGHFYFAEGTHEAWRSHAFLGGSGT